MDQTGKTFTSEGSDPRQWIGRIIIAVVLGEATWSLIVSVMNNLVVPWLGDLLGQSSGLPASFTQRPYNYPDLFVSVLELCIAGMVAAIVNYFLQRPGAEKLEAVKRVPAAPVEPAQVIPQAAAVAATPRAAIAKPAMPQATGPQTAVAQATPMVASPAPSTKPVPATAAPPVTVAPAAPAPIVAPAPVARPVTIAPSAPPVADSVTKPLPPAPKADPPKPKKPKEVYYNIVGEPIPSDDD